MIYLEDDSLIPTDSYGFLIINIDFYHQESLKTKSFEDLNDSREVALEEPIHPEIANQDNPVPQNIPDNHFIVEEPEIESKLYVQSISEFIYLYCISG